MSVQYIASSCFEMLNILASLLAALTRKNVAIRSFHCRIIAGSVGLLILVLAVVYFIQYNNIRLNHIAHPFFKTTEPVNQSICCKTDGLDFFGRPNCTWPCPDSCNEQRAFLIETFGNPVLDTRQACSVESLAFHNPNLTVYVLFTNGQMNSSAVVMETLIENYRNIRLIQVDLNEFLAGTPIESWYHSSEWKNGPYHVAHLSDGLRLVTLFKYGGFYFDLDIIHTRPVINYRNFIAAESGEAIANGVINIDKNHPIIQLAVKNFSLNYRSNAWSHNGPELWMRILKSWCGVKDVKSMDYVRCRGFSVLSRSSFYPIHYSNWKEFFIHRNGTEHLDWLTNDIIGVHVWNKLSYNEPVYKNSTQYYTQLARSYCPRIMSIAPDIF